MPTRQATTRKKADRLKAAAAEYKPRTGNAERLLVVDMQCDENEAIVRSALATVQVVRYDSANDSLDALVLKIRKAHRMNDGPFTSIAVVNAGPDDDGLWAWATDCVADLNGIYKAMTQIAPVTEALVSALVKLQLGNTHIDLLASRLHDACKGLIPALEALYAVDFRASNDDTMTTGADGKVAFDWTLESDGTYDAGPVYLNMSKNRQLSVRQPARKAEGSTAPGAKRVSTVTARSSVLATGRQTMTEPVSLEMHGGTSLQMLQANREASIDPYKTAREGSQFSALSAMSFAEEDGADAPPTAAAYQMASVGKKAGPRTGRLSQV